MALEPGYRLGHYEIIAPAGAGGMGEVYKAKDSHLDRIVAIKVLPTAMAESADLKARFEREAKSISSLNHPNVCALYDVGHVEGIDFLVLEFLEGETLLERIKRSPIGLSETLMIAAQMAGALDKAHRKGLVHRDLKPDNVMLTKEGAKLLDFGLAKLQASAGIVNGVSGVTQTTPLTGTGTIVGTIQYMSPEQLEGSEADARSDIFAFGSVLYQMITGQRPFGGKSQASTIAAIIDREPPPISSIAPMTPPALDRLVKKCLAKDPEDRWQSTRDMADELRWIAQSGTQGGIPKLLSARRKRKYRLSWMIAVVAVLAAGAFAYLWQSQVAPIKTVKRFGIDVDESIDFISWPQISPDGKHLAFKATDTAGRQIIWIRSMDSRQSRPIVGTEDALRPFWSPDSKYLAYSDGSDHLKKIPIQGGPAKLIGEFEGVADGDWGVNNTILFDGGRTDSIKLVSAAGGNAIAITKLDSAKGDVFHMWPEFLPDGEHFLFLASSDTLLIRGEYSLRIGSVESSETVELFEVTSYVRYCEPGYLIYAQDDVLLAQSFDADKLQVTGEPIPIAEDIAARTGSAISYFTVSNEGTLVYIPSDASSRNELIWVDRTGQEIERIGKPGRYGDIALSPDGTRLVYGQENAQLETMDLWIYDLQRDVASRFTFNEADEIGPFWSGDGHRVYYNQGVFPNVTPGYKEPDGISEFTPLLDSLPYITIVTDVSQDGSLAAFSTVARDQPDIELMDMTGDDPMYPVVRTPQDEYLAKFSPNGELIAYGSEESNWPELLIRHTDISGRKWQVSSDGVRSSRWSHDGRNLYYFNWDWELYSVPISYKDEVVTIGTPALLFSRRLSTTGVAALGRFDVTQDGQRFLLVAAIQDASNPEFHIVLHWPEALGSY